ncbi:cytochrome c biogenesis CcdA family protein [Jonesia quinghaiensis]|uniref:cytochrome c biogenesis CcdA family protein n=1 Tax=Jonesia quinghaiensis TaxID=262806 RepID=UPI000A01E642|nr:cytochrome c biogenesis protein CcdA [Jonesia quinghaiensis]
MLLAVPVALLAGLVSFASPCVVPLVPGYVGFVSGLAAQGVGQHDTNTTATKPVASRRVILGVALFVAGFTVVFVAAGVLTGALGAALNQWSTTITRILGVVVIVMGLAFMGVFSALQWERRLHVAPRAGLWGAPVLGFVFGLGWTPCLGPTLVAINALALSEGTWQRGAILAVAYSLGLGLPFILIGGALERSQRILGVLRRYRVAIMRIGGGMLVLLGLALVTGAWNWLATQMSLWIGGVGTVV